MLLSTTHHDRFILILELKHLDSPVKKGTTIECKEVEYSKNGIQLKTSQRVYTFQINVMYKKLELVK